MPMIRWTDDGADQCFRDGAWNACVFRFRAAELWYVAKGLSVLRTGRATSRRAAVQQATDTLLDLMTTPA